MQYLEDFENAISKRRIKNHISYVFNNNGHISEKITKNLSGFNTPANVIQFLIKFNGLIINKPRFLKILDFDELKIIEDKFLFFAIMNEKEKICFDMSNLNNADEWNIVSLKNKFLITSTLSSFLTNKVWAWIDRERTIWKEEYYD